MPLAYVEALTEQIVAIEASERLARISDTSVATGCVKKAESRKHMRTLERHANGGESRQATTADLESIGIPVVTV